MDTKKQVKRAYRDLERAKDAEDLNEIRTVKARIAKLEATLHGERVIRKWNRGMLCTVRLASEVRPAGAIG